MNKIENLPLLTRCKIRLFGKKIWVSDIDTDTSSLAILYKDKYYFVPKEETEKEKIELAKPKSNSSLGSFNEDTSFFAFLGDIDFGDFDDHGF